VQNAVLEALRRCTTLAWCRASNHDPGGNVSVPPPLIEWVLASPTSELNEFLERALSSFQGRVAWEYRIDDGHWTLRPARIREVQEQQPIPLALIASEKLAREEPAFVAEAVADEADLAAHLDRELQKHAICDDGRA